MDTKEMETMVGEYYQVRKEIEDFEKLTLAPLKNKKMELERKIMDVLDELEVTSYKTKFGSVQKATRTSYKLPQERADKEAFLTWLHETKGDLYYWQKVSVNSQTLSAIAKEEYENAKAEGNLEFKIPGLGEPNVSSYLKKGK